MRIAAALALAGLTLVPGPAAAQSPAAQPEPAAPAASPAPPAPPAPPAAAPASPAPAPKVTVDLGGWLVLNGYYGHGGLNATDLPRFAIAAPDGERSLGISVRQSRLRAGVGIPADGLVKGTALKGLVELDFVGGYVANDPSLPIVRLRHAWLSASWKPHGNLSLLLGQTWGVFTGPYFAASLSHLATPRFAGAGFLYRRAPQVRLSGELGGDVALLWTAAALAPIDRNTTTNAAASVGERSGVPNVEARAALAVKAPVKLEVGLSAHYGQEKHLVSGRNDTVDSRGYAVDARVEVPYLTVVGAAFAGENLDIWYSVAPGTRLNPNATAPTDVSNVETKGFWAQAQVTPVKGLQLLAGGGIEQPDDEDVPPTIPGSAGGSTLPTPVDSRQASVGAILNLSSRWRVSVEGTRYWTEAVDGSKPNANQLEVSSLLAF
jgi:hypothetical protein